MTPCAAFRRCYSASRPPPPLTLPLPEPIAFEPLPMLRELLLLVRKPPLLI